MEFEQSGFFYWLKRFFGNYFWIGLVVILLSIILHQVIANKTFIITVLLEVASTLGIAIVIASIFTFASGTSEFISKIRGLLEDIIVSRTFLADIDSDGKRSALAALVKPTTREKEIYSNIEEYYDAYINETLKIAKKSVRSNYHINGRAYFDASNKQIVIEQKASYRIYPSNEGFGKIKHGFQEEDEKTLINSIFISNPHGDREEFEPPELVETEIEGIKYKLSTIDLTKIGKNSSHLDIEACLTLYSSNKQFYLLSVQITQPTDGLIFHLHCGENVEIEDFATFFHNVNTRMNIKDNKDLSIACNQWIGEGAGLSILLVCTKNDHKEG